MRKQVAMLKSNLLRLLPVMVLVIFGVASCAPTVTPTETVTPPTESPSPKPTQTRPAQPTAAPTATISPLLDVDPAALSGIKVRFLHPWTGEIADTLEAIAMAFSLSNAWDIWVEAEGFGSENLMIEDIQSGKVSGELPGLVAVHPYMLGDLEGDYNTIDLSGYLEDPQWGFEEGALADMPQVYFEPFMEGDRLAALPFAPKGTVLFYNQTWGESLGFAAPPEDIAAFREQSCDASFFNREDFIVENDGTGGWLINFDPRVLASWYQAFGGSLAKSGPPSFNDEAGRDAFDYLKSVYDQGCIWIGRQPEPYFYFANRYALMYAGTLDQIPSQRGWMDQAGNDDSWVTLGFPGPAGGVMLVDGPGLMISADSPENQLAAWLFAKHLLEPEVQARLIQAMFTLPVRRSAMESLVGFTRDYPQWAQAVELIEKAEGLPTSQGWGLGQWVLQDAITRLILSEEANTRAILEQLDQTIVELEEVDP